MQCPTCSTPIPEDSRFCMSCGADVSDPNAVSTASLGEAEVVQMVRMLREETRDEFEIEREIERGGMAVVYLPTEIHVPVQDRQWAAPVWENRPPPGNAASTFLTHGRRGVFELVLDG